MNNDLSVKTILEPARDLTVFKQADVVVVGGGSAGVTAAVAAARNGASTLLLERYGHLGGLATGGLVIVIMPMSDCTAEQQVVGLCQEYIDRLDAMGSAVVHPRREDLGSSDPALIAKFNTFPWCVAENKIRMAAIFEAEDLKCVMNDMVEEAGVKLLLHTWGAGAIVEKNNIKGIIIESKQGRQVILGKIFIDTTGDGDMYASAGCRFDAASDQQNNRSTVGLIYRLGKVDVNRYLAFKNGQPEKFKELMRDLESRGGFTMYLRSAREDIMWVNNHIPGKSGINVEDLTWIEVNARKRMLLTNDFLKKYIAGFEKSFLIDTASQVGIRNTRRLIGEYVLTGRDVVSGAIFPDTIAVCPFPFRNPSQQSIHWQIPYRSLLTKEIDNLLVAGRCISADSQANGAIDPIQFCISTGQAAGTAAALALKSGLSPKQVDVKTLQKTLVSQKVNLSDLKI
jgi:hypothetical protein